MSLNRNTAQVHKAAQLGNTSIRCAKRGRRWVATLNNYTKFECTQILDFLHSEKFLFIVGREVGEEKNTPHLQMYFEKKHPVTFNKIKNIMPRAHIEPAKGSREQNLAYCSKEGNYETNIKSKDEIDNEYKRLRKKEFMKGDKLDIVIKEIIRDTDLFAPFRPPRGIRTPCLGLRPE